MNRTECTPFAFRVYATYEVNDRLKDISVHSLIDKLNPTLRSKDEVDGKIRVREFYKMTPDEAYEILEMIAKINGLEKNLKLWHKTKEEVEDEKTAKVIETLSKNRHHFKDIETNDPYGTMIPVLDGKITKKMVIETIKYISGVSRNLNFCIYSIYHKKAKNN